MHKQIAAPRVAARRFIASIVALCRQEAHLAAARSSGTWP